MTTEGRRAAAAEGRKERDGRDGRERVRHVTYHKYGDATGCYLTCSMSDPRLSRLRLEIVHFMLLY